MAIFTAKNIAIFLGLAVVAFGAATIVLAVQKADLSSKLDDARNQLEITTTLSAITPTIDGNTSPGGSTNPTSSGSSPTGPSITITTPTGSGSSPGVSTVTTPKSTTPGHVTDDPGHEHINYRLPRNVLPKRYDLYLEPNLETGNFSGRISIPLQIVENSQIITIHSSGLELFGFSILNVNTRMRIRVLSYEENLRTETFTITFSETLRTDQPYTLSIEYRGQLSGLNGFYRSSYVDEFDETRYLATTMFEPTYARKAFPCFDEPDIKAPFRVTLVRPSGSDFVALSNMNVDGQKLIGGSRTEVEFKETVPMSTYLTCFIVADFVSVSGIVRPDLGDEFDLNVYSTKQQKDKLDYALQVGIGVTKFYIEYFGIEYPLPKLDLAGIPDFNSGAMEQWGLVTFRETALLFDEATSSSPNKLRVASVIAHEIAHMWFGNLVTMKWWSDLWLKEGFANFIEYKGVDAIHKDWNIMDHFILDQLHNVMSLDASLASHPIVKVVESPDQVAELFDSITYSKGASIVRMLEDFVGADKFKQGVTNYLNKYSYDSATTEDLLTEIEALGFDYDIKSMVKTWTEQMGLPVINVEKLDSNSYIVTQNRFLSNPEDYLISTVEPSPFNYKWSIPLTYFDSQSGVVKRELFEHSVNEITIKVDDGSEWIKFNKDQVGFYRVNYPQDTWKALSEALIKNVNTMTAGDRASLVDDVFALADATQVRYGTAFDLTRYLIDETSYVPWEVASSKLLALKEKLYYSPEVYESYITYARELIDNAYILVKDWEIGSDFTENFLTSTILNAACSLGHTGCLETVSEKFESFIQNPNVKESPDIRETIYYYGMMTSGSEKSWNVMWNAYKNEVDTQEKIKLMKGLAGIKEPWILQKFIDLSWDEKNVRGQDYISCLTNIANNPIGRPIVWDHVRNNWEELVARFGLNSRVLGRLIPSITSGFSTQIKLEEMTTFFEKYPEAGAGTASRKEANENIKNNMIWVEQNAAEIYTWLTEFSSK